MRVSAATLGFASIVCVALVIAYRVVEPRQLVTEQSDTRDLLVGIATETKANNAVLTPTATRFPSATATRKPVIPTETPHPTYDPASPVAGIQRVPAWTPTVAPSLTVELTYPPCDLVTPRPYADVYCEVT